MQVMDKKNKLLDCKRNIADLEKLLHTSLDNMKPIDHLEEAREITLSLQELDYENTHLIGMLSEADKYDRSSLEHRIDSVLSEFGKLQHTLELFLTHCLAPSSDDRDIW